MDKKFQVWAWYKKFCRDSNPVTHERKYHLVWGGRSLVKAIWHAWVAKGYSGCVKIEWRGTRW